MWLWQSGFQISYENINIFVAFFKDESASTDKYVLQTAFAIPPELNIDESALLVGLLPAPARYSPIRHPDKAFARRNTVLRLMREQKKISDAVYVEARSTDINNIQKYTKNLDCVI